MLLTLLEGEEFDLNGDERKNYVLMVSTTFTTLELEH